MPPHSDLLCFTFQVTAVDRRSCGSSCSVASWIHTLFIYHNLYQIFCQCNSLFFSVHATSTVCLSVLGGRSSPLALLEVSSIFSFLRMWSFSSLDSKVRGRRMWFTVRTSALTRWDKWLLTVPCFVYRMWPAPIRLMVKYLNTYKKLCYCWRLWDEALCYMYLNICQNLSVLCTLLPYLTVCMFFLCGSF